MTAMKEQRTTASSSSAKSAKGGAKDGADAAEPAKKKLDFKSKKFLIILVAIIGVGYFGYSSFLAPKPKPAPPKGGVVLKQDPLVINLAGGHYLKIEVDPQLIDGTSPTDFYFNQGAQLVINEYANKKPAQLESSKQTAILQKDLLKKIEKAYPKMIFDIFVTQFTIQ